MVELTNIVTVPLQTSKAPALGGVISVTSGASSTAPSSGVPLQVFNLTPFEMTNVVLNNQALTGAPSAGVTSAGQISTPLAGSLVEGGYKIEITFEGGSGWSVLIPQLPSGPPRPVMLFCFWNGCILSDYNGQMRTIMWL